MFPARWVLISILLLAGSGSLDRIAATPAAFTCPISAPVDERPDPLQDPFAEDAALFYENGMWVTIPDDGILELTNEHELQFGPLAGWRSQTFTWLRDEGVVGFVYVSGKRLDAESDLAPQTPLSPQRQYVRVGYVQTGIAFPGTGCWEVTGSVADHSITFVIAVRFVEDPVSSPQT